MSEGAENKPETLPNSGHYVRHEGPHGFERPMIAEMNQWLFEIIPEFEPKRSLPDRIPHAPSTAIQSPDVGEAGIDDILQSAAKESGKID